jgi:hypothetical protein
MKVLFRPKNIQKSIALLRASWPRRAARLGAFSDRLGVHRCRQLVPGSAQSASPGRINISVTVAGHVGALFEFEPRGSIEAKHDRTHEMFFLNRLKPEFSRGADGCLPNQNFAAAYNRRAGIRLARVPAFLETRTER